MIIYGYIQRSKTAIIHEYMRLSQEIPPKKKEKRRRRKKGGKRREAEISKANLLSLSDIWRPFRGNYGQRP